MLSLCAHYSNLAKLKADMQGSNTKLQLAIQSFNNNSFWIRCNILLLPLTLH